MEWRIPRLSADEKSTLLKGISQLSEVQASLIVLHYLHDWPIADVIKKLELSPAEFSSHHHAALMALRRYGEKFDGI